MSEMLALEAYCDPDVFTREQEAVFNQHWWLIGGEHEVAEGGAYLAADLGRLPIFVLRDKAGELKGFHNVCRHRAGPIVGDGAGKCRGNLLVCRYHGWSYDFSGKLVNAHSLNGKIAPKDFSLYPVRVDVWNGLVFACAGNDAPPLLHWLGDIKRIAEGFPKAQDMLPHGAVEKSGVCNWKCYGENSCEGYHVSLVHKTLDQTMGGEKVVIDNYENGEFVGFDVTYRGSEADPTRVGKGFWIYKYPGLLLHYSDYTLNAESVFPVSHDTIAIKRWFWVVEDEAKARGVVPDKIIASSSAVIDEDIDICEKVFRNLQAGVYQPGVLSPEDEPGAVYFQELVKRSMA